VTLVWVTGNSGTGKSTACEFLQRSGQLAFDADWEGSQPVADVAAVILTAAAVNLRPLPYVKLHRFALA
jgi:dephospho-CoA kinase